MERIWCSLIKRQSKLILLEYNNQKLCSISNELEMLKNNVNKNH